MEQYSPNKRPASSQPTQNGSVNKRPATTASNRRPVGQNATAPVRRTANAVPAKTAAPARRTATAVPATAGSAVPKMKPKATRRKVKWGRVIVLALSLIAVLTLALVGIYNSVVDHYVGKINIVTEEDDLIFQTELITEEGETSVEVIEPDHNGEFNASNLPLICDTKDVKNILLLAVDSRKNEAGRTDVMMLLSINSKTGKIVLCSFMRDLLVKYPATPKSPLAGKYSKLNHAHAYGGPELTMAVLKETFNIEIDHYAKVNFFAFRDIVDAIGGVELELTAAEAKTINRILNATMTVDKVANQQLKVTKADFLKSTEAGVYRLNGVQALSHVRNRVNGSDYARTRRQRDVLQAMVKQAKTLSLPKLNSLLNTVLPMITTNVPKEELKDMVGNAPSYLTYDISSTRVPGDRMYREVNYNLVPDLQKNCNALYEAIYGVPAPAGSGNGAENFYPPSLFTTTTTTTTTPTTTTAPTSSTVPASSSVPPSSSTSSGGTEPPSTTTEAPTTTTAPPTTTTQPSDQGDNGEPN